MANVSGSFLASYADVLRGSSLVPAPRTFAVIGLRFFPLKSADVRRAGTRDELLRTSAFLSLFLSFNSYYIFTIFIRKKYCG